jgi:hypothetical protein
LSTKANALRLLHQCYTVQKTRKKRRSANPLQLVDLVEKILGGCSRIRTCDPLIKSQLLYQLSYTPKLISDTAISWRAVTPGSAGVQ